MVERIGNRVALRFLLQIIISDFRSSINALFDITIFERTKHLIILMSPNAGKEIGLQLQTHTHSIGFLLTHLLHLAMRLAQYAKQILHMVTHFVRYHIGIGKIAVSSE